jgi:hypothetical protein
VSRREQARLLGAVVTIATAVLVVIGLIALCGGWRP